MTNLAVLKGPGPWDSVRTLQSDPGTGPGPWDSVRTLQSDPGTGPGPCDSVQTLQSKTIGLTLGWITYQILALNSQPSLRTINFKFVISNLSKSKNFAFWTHFFQESPKTGRILPVINQRKIRQYSYIFIFASFQPILMKIFAKKNYDLFQLIRAISAGIRANPKNPCISLGEW